MVADKIKPRLQEMYENEVSKKVLEKFGIQNVNRLPKVSKIIVNTGIGRFLENQKLKPDIRDTVIDTLTKVTGQRPIQILAKKSVANFKVREGAPSAYMVTLRRDRMWHFLERLIHLAIPRIKDFRGVKDTAFDAGATTRSVPPSRRSGRRSTWRASRSVMA